MDERMDRLLDLEGLDMWNDEGVGSKMGARGNIITCNCNNICKLIKVK